MAWRGLVPKSWRDWRWRVQLACRRWWADRRAYRRLIDSQRPDDPYACPICGVTFCQWQGFRESEFRPERLERCPNPYCRSMARTRSTWLLLLRSGWLADRPRLLHVAPAAGLAWELRRRLGDQYLTLDKHMAQVDLRADLTHVPLESGQFDLILCSHTLEYIADDLSAMREMYRLCKPTGRVLIREYVSGLQTVEDPGDLDDRQRQQLFGAADHVRNYGSDIVDRLTSVGFAVQRLVVDQQVCITETEYERFNIARGDSMFCCRHAVDRADVSSEAPSHDRDNQQPDEEPGDHIG